ncbi:hypothetical protein BLNAU_7526 [Blattamonas nauphoetae]|uniref:Uncharacterized protein n=1 Tax=Blattamonas nauphoetae TaxID=2049346 RepID=A0ABQ9Y1K8_9EUKA|nr:hypothetical protein BLNAU_7526 [Blattamonas nauphoetae]
MHNSTDWLSSSLRCSCLIQNTSWKGHAQREILNDGTVCHILSISSCFTVELPLFCHSICYWRGECVDPSLSTALSSRQELQRSPAVLAVTTQHQCMEREKATMSCVSGQYRDHCEDDVASRLVRWVGVLRLCLHVAVFACAPSAQVGQKQSRPSLESGRG